MPRRVSLPGAAELFRPTQGETTETAAGPGAASGSSSPESHSTGSHSIGSPSTTSAPSATDDPIESGEDGNGARGSGRVRHDEKITVYVSSDELLALEQARLTMRARHGLAVDRGRIVREAISVAMGDLAANGAESELVRRLSSS